MSRRTTCSVRFNMAGRYSSRSSLCPVKQQVLCLKSPMVMLTPQRQWQRSKSFLSIQFHPSNWQVNPVTVMSYAAVHCLNAWSMAYRLCRRKAPCLVQTLQRQHLLHATTEERHIPWRLLLTALGQMKHYNKKREPDFLVRSSLYHLVPVLSLLSRIDVGELGVSWHFTLMATKYDISY